MGMTTAEFMAKAAELGIKDHAAKRVVAMHDKFAVLGLEPTPYEQILKAYQGNSCQDAFEDALAKKE